MKPFRRAAALAAGAAILFAACSSGGASTAPSTAAATPTAAPPSVAASVAPSEVASAAAAAKVRVQLQWTPQAQFAGELAAASLGYYKDENLDVTLLDGGPNVIPQQVGSAPDGPEFTLAWVPKVLQARESGSDLVNIAQIFQKSGTRSVSWKDSNITGPDQFKGKKIGVWDFGNEFEVTSGAAKSGLTQGKDYEKVIQPFNMALLLNKQIDVAEAMNYNEYAQVLEATNPATGQLYQPEDLNVIDWNQVGTAMLQDAVFARAAWLAQPGNEDVATRFLKATFKGWIYCRDNPDKCVDLTVKAGTTLGKGHQAWQMNEVNSLIWPSPNGIGMLPKDFYDQTIQISKDGKVITKDPDPSAVRTDLAQKALDALASDDTKGAGYTKGTVQVTPGGE
jgi:NitT/TauT family transport system substrate-binding protein